MKSNADIRDQFHLKSIFYLKNNHYSRLYHFFSFFLKRCFDSGKEGGSKNMHLNENGNGKGKGRRDTAEGRGKTRG